MQTATDFLETRSKAQALDWSLVLISQGIDSVVTYGGVHGMWLVEIAHDDRPRALESIAVYERENSVPWRKELKGSGLLFDVRVMIWFAVLAFFYWLIESLWPGLKAAGAVDRAAILAGEWWRLFTAVTLHADIAHLAANVSIGLVFLGLAMGAFGAGNALLLSFVGGALGNVATLVAHAGEPFRSLGASGMVMASLGLITAHSLIFGQHEKRMLLLGRGVMAGCLLVVLLGFSPKSDVVAHVGGFIAGTILGAGAMGFRKYLLRQSVNVTATLIFMAVLISTWWLALK